MKFSWSFCGFSGDCRLIYAFMITSQHLQHFSGMMWLWFSISNRKGKPKCHFHLMTLTSTVTPPKPLRSSEGQGLQMIVCVVKKKKNYREQIEDHFMCAFHWSSLPGSSFLWRKMELNSCDDVVHFPHMDYPLSLLHSNISCSMRLHASMWFRCV